MKFSEIVENTKKKETKILVSYRVLENVKNDFDALCKENNVSPSEVINKFMIESIKESKLSSN